MRRQFAWFVAFPVVLVLSLGALAPAEEKKAEEKTGAALLESKGLRKIGSFFVLGEEAALKKKLRELEPLRKKVMDAQKKASAAEKVVEQKKQLINQCLQQRHDLEIALNNVNNVEQHNRMVNALNELSDRIEILEKALHEDKVTKTLRATATEVSEQYVEAVMQLRKQCKAVKAKYEELAADAQVKEAIDEVNKTEHPAGKLGPGLEFIALDSNLKRMEASVVSETIAMRRDEGDLWTVSVTFNGQHSRDMTIDTGASSVVLPYKMATEVGLTPSEKDPTITCILADGHAIKCKMVYAKTVRVGKFTVEHVECGVMPADCPEASAMLGQSFLKNFTFRIDNANGKLIMAQVGPANARTRTGGKQTEPAKTDEPGEDKTAIPDLAAGEKGGPEQMVKLLKLDNEKESDHIQFTDDNNQPLQFSRSKWETVDNLRKIGGDPDEIHKVPLKAKDNGEQAAPWKMYTWGPLYVLADDTGHARYFSLTKEVTPAKKPAVAAPPAKTEPTPAVETKPKTEKPEAKKPGKTAPAKDDDKDVFEK
jgi:clan AA aspartic protease (TIGR02281 family)